MSSPTLVDLGAPSVPFNRFFQRGVGSCHAYLTLREDLREHVRLAQQEIGFGGIRFHGIFTEYVGVVHNGEEADGPRLNFQNVTKIYEFFVNQGMKPFVEIGFMPTRLASGTRTIFDYRGNITPPKEWAQWSRLVRRFVAHLVDHFGIEEVLTWHFEVWNEPDLHNTFWTGTMADYFTLYAETARAVKAVDDRLRVGGPATSKTMWVPDLLAFCATEKVPLDFISTHHYCVDADLVQGVPEGPMYYRGMRGMKGDVERVRTQIAASAFPDAELHFTEWNSCPAHEDVYGKDTAFTAAFALQTIKEVSGLVDSYMWWTVSDIFEESGLSLRPFTGKYGLVNQHGIKKPVFHAFRWLAQMYDHELPLTHSSARATRSTGCDVRLLAWNLPEVLETDLGGGDWKIKGEARRDEFVIKGLAGRYRVRMWTVDDERGNALHAWRAMGAPDYPKAAQIAGLKAAAEPVLVRDETLTLNADCVLTYQVAPCALLFCELARC
ncbi:MAG: xynB [Rariglobus sp.]|jgi:xylan 1,4-beta-xylosidase|nr:xynB [Rariglobus sp.]